MPGLCAKHFPYILRNSLVTHSTQMKNVGLRKFIKQSPHGGFRIYLTSKPMQQILSPLFTCNLGFPGGACQCRRHERCGFNPWVGRIPWRRARPPTLVLLPGESQGQRSLVGYGPQGLKELDTAEHTYTSNNQPGGTADDTIHVYRGSWPGFIKGLGYSLNPREDLKSVHFILLRSYSTVFSRLSNS